MKYVLGIVAIIFVILIGVLLASSGGEDKPKEDKIVLAEEAGPGTSAVFTTQGELVGQNERRAIRIKVSQSERRLEVLEGYEEASGKTHVYPNTEAAYETFLIALDRAGFANERESLVDDERGVCPLGKRYIYEFKQYSQQLVRLWDASCSDERGTFAGDDSTIRKLFENQIPDYRKRVRDVDL